MSDQLHLIIPGAVLPHDANAALPPLASNLRVLLAAMAVAGRIECGEDSPSTPFELALAQANGLPGGPGQIPWAAFESVTIGVPCAFIKLCHWQVGMDYVMVSPPENLAVDDETSRALLSAMAPYFQEDGIALNTYGTLPGTWLATGEAFRSLRTVSMEPLVGRRLTSSVLDVASAPAATLRRLQNEMQMLLYTHPANEKRRQKGFLPVNSFWVAGAGVLDKVVPFAPGIRVESRLNAPALSRDAAAHAQAWQQVDADSCAALLALLRAGGEARLTLCGEQAAQTFVPARNGIFSKLKIILGLQPSWDGRNML